MTSSMTWACWHLHAIWHPELTPSSGAPRKTCGHAGPCNANLRTIAHRPAGKAACAFELAAMWGDTDHAKDED